MIDERVVSNVLVRYGKHAYDDETPEVVGWIKADTAAVLQAVRFGEPVMDALIDVAWFDPSDDAQVDAAMSVAEALSL